MSKDDDEAARRARLDAAWERSLRKKSDLPAEYRMTREQENSAKISELWLVLRSDLWDVLRHDPEVSNEEAVDCLVRNIANLHLMANAIIKRPEMNFQEQTAKLIRCVVDSERHCAPLSR